MDAFCRNLFVRFCSFFSSSALSSRHRTGSLHRGSLLLGVHLVLLVAGGGGARVLLVGVVAGIGVLALLADLGAVDPEEEGDAAAGQGHEEEDHAGPLVAAAGVHLLGE